MDDTKEKNKTEAQKNIDRITKKRLAIVERLMKEGVKFIDPLTAYIDEAAVRGEGTIIYPGVIIEEAVTIGKDCIIGKNSRIKDSVISDGVQIEDSVILSSKIGENTSVGPYAYLRTGTVIGKDCRIGDFVEIKNSIIGDGTKASHLTYIGDSDLGRDINLGCGVVFVNYDGIKKHRSTIGDKVFIGCNSNIISPVSIGDNAYIAAGSTVNEDVPSGNLYINREREVYSKPDKKNRYK